MNILVVFTGGTIGSVIEGDTISNEPNGKSRLIGRFFSQYPEYRGKVSFDCRYPVNKLSENMLPSDWKKIVDLIMGEPLNLYTAVVIAHGSDTLAFFAAAMSAVLGKLNKPIYIVASDKVLDDPTSNGLINLKSAVDAAFSSGQNGVFVPYKNPGEMKLTMHRGYQITQAGILGASFYSIPAIELYCSSFNFDKKVILLMSYVGADYSFVKLHNGDAVLLCLYHGATAPVEAVAQLCENAAQNGAAVYAASVDSSAVQYKTTAQLRAVGVHFFSDVTVETAYAVLLNRS